MREAARVISVSPQYPTALRDRYPDLSTEHFVVLPFGASERDAEFVRARSIRHSIFDPADGLVHWTYLGRGGTDMALALRALLLALARLREAEPRANQLRLHFVGTSYAARGLGVPSVAPLAREAGVADLVEEHTDRIPYLEGLALLQASDAVLVIGSDDPGYSASKVYPFILAGRPLLAVVHSAGLAGEVVQKCKAGMVTAFDTGEVALNLSHRVEPQLRALLTLPRGATPPTDWSAFSPYTARAMTRQQCLVFDEAISGIRTRPVAAEEVGR
jgi:hypothetical protein